LPENLKIILGILESILFSRDFSSIGQGPVMGQNANEGQLPSVSWALDWTGTTEEKKMF